MTRVRFHRRRDDGSSPALDSGYELARRLRVLGRVLAVVAAGLWFVVLVAPGASAAPTPHPAGMTNSASNGACPVNSTCETIPASCPTGTTCPEVIVTPATALGPNQWVFITAENFPPGDPIYIYYCSSQYTLAQQDPICMLQATPELLNPEVVLTASSEGTASISFATQEDANDGNTPLNGKIPGTQTVGTFYCDDFADPCSIDVTDPYLDSDGKLNFMLNPNNAVAVPVSFAKSSSGCASATFVSTSSEFGIDQIFPTASQYDCTGKTPAIGIDVAIDSLAAVTGLVGGADQLAFIDDPNSPDVQAQLALLKASDGKPGYSLIPVGLSAQVIAFKSLIADSANGRIFPDNTFSLTPTMVAGLITNYYSFENGADVANCGPAYGGDCPLIAALNSISGFRAPGEYGAFVRSDPSSSTSDVFNWICSAPNVPVYLGTYKVVDPNIASKVLLAGLAAGGVNDKTCPTTDSFPPLLNTFEWTATNDPNQQELKLSGFVAPPNATNTAVAGFAPMNSSEANYYGLLPAALQNAAGRFVLPTATSLDAALSGATVNKNGTLSANFDDKNPAAYPLPEIWYAVVPTANQTAANAVAIKTLLDDVLNITGGSQTADLPPGFVPLPASMYTASLAAVAKDVQGPPPTTTTTTTTTTTSPTTTTTGPTTTTSTSTTTTTSTSTTTTTTLASVPTTTSPKVTPTTTPKVTPTTSPRITPTTVAFQSTSFSVLGHGDAWLVPAFVSFVAGALFVGPGLLLKTRRRPRGAH